MNLNEIKDLMAQFDYLRAPLHRYHILKRRNHENIP